MCVRTAGALSEMSWGGGGGEIQTVSGVRREAASGSRRVTELSVEVGEKWDRG